jgi:tripartite-type tricarboxylate transporter receptor subunit TctC
VLVAAAATLFAPHAVAEDFPSKPIHLIVPYAAGGSAEVLGRTLATAMGPLLGQTVLVDLRPGAGGNLGAELVARSTPGDGYTVLLASVSLSTGASFAHLGFDPRTDLVAVAGIATLPSLLLVASTSPYKSLVELIAAAKAGQKLSFGSAGTLTGSHLFGEMLKTQAGIEMVHIPYRGSGAAYPDLIGGRVTMMFDVMGSAIGQVNGGLVRPLAITSARRAQALPDVPTLQELGYAGFDIGTWFGMFVPVGTPADARLKLERATLAALKTPAMAARLASVMADPIPGPGTEFGKWFANDVERWSRLAEDHPFDVSK